MQKKLIALAVAGLISAPAFAQSSVTLYGTLDYGYSWLGHAPQGDNDWGKGNKGEHGINSGISKANRLGFKGVEDLGNGLKAVFVLETGLSGDEGPLFSGKGVGAARQSYAALAGGFGTVAFGRHYTPQHLFTSAVDPFGKNGLGSAGNVLLQDKRLNNLVAYITPTFSGFNAIFAWSWNGTKASAAGSSFGGEQEQVNTTTGSNVNVWAFAPSYTNGGLFVGLNYHGAKVNFVGSKNVNSAGSKDIVALHAVDLYAAYQFSGIPLKIGVTVGERIATKKAIKAVTGGAVNKATNVLQGLIGVTYSVTPNDKLQFSVAGAREKAPSGQNLSNARIFQYALGYEHALSKRTALYAQVAFQQENSAFKGRDNGAQGFAYSISTDGTVGGLGQSNFSGDTAGANFTRGLAVGIRHDF